MFLSSIVGVLVVAVGAVWLYSDVYIESVSVQAMKGLWMAARETSVGSDMVSNMQATHALAGRRCLVTGGNRGLGKGVAKLLHSFGCHTIVATRSLKTVVGLAPDHIASLVQLDLADFASICQAANTTTEPFDVVVLNAGVAPYLNERTAEGYEQALGTNCIGNLVFTAALYEHNLLARNAKVVVVVSETHRAVPELDLAHVLDDQDYGLAESMSFYARSKLCLVTVAQSLSRRLAAHGVAVHTICPGPVATDIARGAPAVLQPVIAAAMTLFPTPDSAARSVALLAASPDFAGPSGSYHHMYVAKPPRADTLNVSSQDALWALLTASVRTHSSSCVQSFDFVN